MLFARFFLPILLLLLAACDSEQNDPYPRAERGKNILYSAFTDRPKHLDPVQSYSEDEITFTAQIYEPPLQYHYLKRPYTLIPLTSEAVPVPRYYDDQGIELPADAPLARLRDSVYEIRIRPGIRYQPHPAFALDEAGEPLYRDLDREQLLRDRDDCRFPADGTRELVADDYIYQIKRLAHPRLHSPIFSMMAERIVGLRELGAALQAEARRCRPAPGWISIAFRSPASARVDRYTYRISCAASIRSSSTGWRCLSSRRCRARSTASTSSRDGREEPDARLVSGRHRPVHADAEQSQQPHGARTQPELPRRDLSLRGRADDQAAGLLADCGKPLPFIDAGGLFAREGEHSLLEQVPAGLLRCLRDFLRQLRPGGAPRRRRRRAVDRRDARQGDPPADQRARVDLLHGFQHARPGRRRPRRAPTKLRQALSIAIDQEEFISIFMNGRGIAATSPLPPGIFGYLEGEEGSNPVVYDWVDGRPRRKPLAGEATARRSRLAEWSPRDDGEPLVLNLDTTTGGMGDKSRLDWLTRQFAKLDIQLVVRSTDFNRFQEKVRKGAVQLYYLGWNADYPDPENFLFLLAGSEGKVAKGGEKTPRTTPIRSSTACSSR
jgi:oligopeptide transport system substrate-binding protein